jgi:hypothetical protein
MLYMTILCTQTFNLDLLLRCEDFQLINIEVCLNIQFERTEYFYHLHVYGGVERSLFYTTTFIF